MKKGTFGLLAEYIIKIIYKIKFYQILHHRLRNAGEIDLIACRGKNLIFIEVKGRSSNVDDQFIFHKQIIKNQKSSESFSKF